MKITFAAPHSGCAWWRARQPAWIIQKKNLAEVRILDIANFSPDDMQTLMGWGDIVMLQSAMGIGTVAAVKKFQEAGKAVVGDYDDLSFSLSPFNPAYKTLGLKDVIIKMTDTGEVKQLYKDGEGGFSIKANYFRFRSLQDLLASYNGVTTTTKFIKDEYSKYSKHINILPNSIDFNLFKPFPKKETDQVRIGWTASDSHYSEIWLVKRIMKRIFAKYGKRVRFILLGNLTQMSIEFQKNDFERHNFIKLNTYPIKLASLNLDIGLCPLNKDDPYVADFNRAKSALKWSEYSALKVPSVCSKIEAYDPVEDGITGMVGDTENEFFDKLCELIEDAKLRKTITQNAFDRNYEDFNLEKNVILWIDAYEQAIEEKEKCGLPSWDSVPSGSDTLKI